jgi:TolA-binding protein
MRNLAIIFTILVLFASGCHRKPKQTPPQTTVTALPAVAVTLPPVTLATGPLPPPPLAATVTPVPMPNVVSPLEEANQIFNAGNYPEAIKAYENYLQRQPSGEYRDEALFNLAQAYAMPGTGSTDQNKSIAVLKQLIEQYPASPHRIRATLLLSLQSELLQLTADAQKRERLVKQLTTEIDKVKQIDADRRKRP